MRKNDWMKVTLMAVGLCLYAFAGYAQDQSSSQQTGDPVADAARKAREGKQKKDAQKAKKVYTDEDIKPAPPDKPDLGVELNRDALERFVFSGVEELTIRRSALRSP